MEPAAPIPCRIQRVVALQRPDDVERRMLAFLILAVTFGLGFAAGYGVRDQISRSHRRGHRRGGVSRKSPEPKGGPADDLVMDLDGLLVAANDDVAGTRRRQQHEPGVERSEKPDDFDGAVRDLLSELNRRSSEPARRVRR
jgi:hypothetical protein